MDNEPKAQAAVKKTATAAFKRQRRDVADMSAALMHLLDLQKDRAKTSTDVHALEYLRETLDETLAYFAACHAESQAAHAENTAARDGSRA